MHNAAVMNQLTAREQERLKDLPSLEQINAKDQVSPHWARSQVPVHSTLIRDFRAGDDDVNQGAPPLTPMSPRPMDAQGLEGLLGKLTTSISGRRVEVSPSGTHVMVGKGGQLAG